MDEIRDWMVFRSAHAYCNVLCVSVIARAEHDGWILDVNGRRAWNLRGFVQELDSVEELRGRPKLLLLHTYPTGTASTHIRYKYQNYCSYTHSLQVPKLLLLHILLTGTKTTAPTHTSCRYKNYYLYTHTHTYPTGTKTPSSTHIPYRYQNYYLYTHIHYRYQNYYLYTHTLQVPKLLLLHILLTGTKTTAPTHTPYRYQNYCSYTYSLQVPKLLLLHTLHKGTKTTTSTHTYTTGTKNYYPYTHTPQVPKLLLLHTYPADQNYSSHYYCSRKNL